MTRNTDKAVKSLKDAILALRKEREEIDERISAMEETLQVISGTKRGPGRPPGSKNKKKPMAATRSKKKVKRNWSPAARKAASDRMKKIWADRRRKG